MNKWQVGAPVAVLVVVVAVGLVLSQPENAPSVASVPLPEGFVLPVLDSEAAKGAPLFAQNCQACHGPAATGSENGPPLVHRIYEPGHHGDNAFYAAVANGSLQHHWQFGDMAPVEGVSQPDVTAIIAYVRALQRANGID